MKHSLSKILLGLCVLGTASTSYAADKHVHGEAELYIAMQGQKLLIELESPAANIIGFEHKPHTKAQKETLHIAMDTLASYQSLITFAKGECQQTDSNIESPFGDHDDEHEKHHDHHKEEKHAGHHGHNHDKHDEETHADFHITYSLTCKNIQDISEASISAFKNFPGIEELNVSWVTEKGQGGIKAENSKTQIKF